MAEYALLLQAEFKQQGTESIGGAAGRVVLLPTVVINNRQYRGHLDAVSITKALCSAFDETTEPEVCPNVLAVHIFWPDCACTNA